MRSNLLTWERRLEEILKTSSLLRGCRPCGNVAGTQRSLDPRRVGLKIVFVLIFYFVFWRIPCRVGLQIVFLYFVFDILMNPSSGRSANCICSNFLFSILKNPSSGRSAKCISLFCIWNFEEYHSTLTHSIMWECVESPQSTKTICIDKKLVCLISIHPQPYTLPWKCFVGFILRQFCLFVQQTLYVRLENILSTGSRPLRVTEVPLNSSQLWANWIDVFTGNPHFTIILRTLVWLLTELVKTCNMQLPFNLKHFSVFGVFLLLILISS